MHWERDFRNTHEHVCVFLICQNMLNLQTTLVSLATVCHVGLISLHSLAEASTGSFTPILTTKMTSQITDYISHKISLYLSISICLYTYNLQNGCKRVKGAAAEFKELQRGTIGGKMEPGIGAKPSNARS